MDRMQEKRWKRTRRHFRTRRRVAGTPERPRLAVHRTLKHIYAQVIDDESARTLCAASTRTGELKELGQTGNRQAAAKVGELIGQRAVAAGIEKVVFDRGGFLFHGRVKALAEAARKAGLDF